MMVRYVHRHDLGIVAALLIAGYVYFVAPARAQDGQAQNGQANAEQVSRAGSADRPLVIREHAGWDRFCDAIEAPVLVLDRPPRHGTVCARAGDIKIEALYLGTEAQCIGRLVRGVRLIYRPAAGFSGDDGLRYAALYPSHRRAVSVQVQVHATAGGQSAQGGAAGSVPAAMTTPSQQPGGPVPHCVDLMF